MKRNYVFILAVLFFCSACGNQTNKDVSVQGEEEYLVIAHRGSKYWAPEETEAAYRCARNMGADYLELDIQMTSDSVLVAVHDNTLGRTTNVATVFPERKDAGIGDFSLKELRALDPGSWYNREYPDRARRAYGNLCILTLEDVIMIAEGYRICYENDEPVPVMSDGEWTGHYKHEKDSADNGNRPGIYLETKSPKPGVERLLTKELSRLGWNIHSSPKEIPTTAGMVAVGNTDARLILQTFSKKSILELNKLMPGVPKCFLLWYPKLEDNLEEGLKNAIAFCRENHVQILGPSLSGGSNNYGELCADWMTDLYHQADLLVHPYTIDTREQQEVYMERVDGFFTNRTDLSLEAYGRKNAMNASTCLDKLGYLKY